VLHTQRAVLAQAQGGEGGAERRPQEHPGEVHRLL